MKREHLSWRALDFQQRKTFLIHNTPPQLEKQKEEHKKKEGTGV